MARSNSVSVSRDALPSPTVREAALDWRCCAPCVGWAPKLAPGAGGGGSEGLGRGSEGRRETGKEREKGRGVKERGMGGVGLGLGRREG
jgi:hypothetical protein